MRKMIVLFAMLAALLALTTCAFLPSFALADTVAPALPDFGAMLASLSNLKNAGALGVTLAASQAALAFAGSSKDPLTGPAKLLLVSGLTLGVGVLSLKVAGADWASAAMNSTTLAAFQVFGHQLWKQFVSGSGPTAGS